MTGEDGGAESSSGGRTAVQNGVGRPSVGDFRDWEMEDRADQLGRRG